jgi:phosphoribosyl 1,2-cyclic phosphate phosphodiesterase
LKITFLGTGTSQGVPVIGCQCDVCRSMDYRDKRLRASVHIEVDGLSIVIDTGPDFRQQMLREGVNHLDAVLFTHSHRDHLAGLDDVRAYNYLQDSDMPLYATPDVLQQIQSEFYYAFAPQRYPGIPQLQLNAIDHKPFTIGSLTVTPLPVMHLKLPVLGFRIGNFSYITDANLIPAQTYDLLKGTEVLVLNALQKDKHLSHFTLAEALEEVPKIGAKQTYFTHMSHKMGLHKEVLKDLPESVALAHDGLTIVL